jgi:PAS domain S-box-containing protein
VVITLQDIDPLKRGLQAAEEARDYAEGMIETVREPLVVLDSDLRVQRATQAFYDMFLVSREETQGRFLYDLGSGQWQQPRLRELIGNALFRSEPFYDFEIDHEFPHVGRRVVRLNGRRIPFPQAERRMLLLSIEDVTQRREIAEIRYQRLFETAKDGIVVIDPESETVQDVNLQFLEMTEYSRESLIGRHVSEIGKQLGSDEIGAGIESARRLEVVRHEDLELRTRSGSPIRVEVIGNSYNVGTQPVIQFNVRDVSARYKALKDLLESEQRFRLFVESIGDFALFQMDLGGNIVAWNTGAERLLGWSEKEAIGKPASMVFTPEERLAHEPEKELERARTDGRTEDERWHLRKDGTRFFASGVLSQMRDDRNRLIGFAKVMRDMTRHKQQEEQLRRSVSQKETLVREIHHRVKNNLQVIVSLLGMQSRYTSDSQVLSAFQEAEGRLRAIAHIHERLYASDELTEIEFAGYIRGLTEELIQLHSESSHPIRASFEVAELNLDLERAIPAGLIANELILNSIKHGLRERSGLLTVKLARVAAPATLNNDELGWAELVIADTGRGLPPELDPATAKSMGLRLVSMLVRQLRGRLEIRDGIGAAISVAFPLENISSGLEEVG